MDTMMGIYRGLTKGVRDTDNDRQAALELLDASLAGDPMRAKFLALLDEKAPPGGKQEALDRVRDLSRSKDPLVRAVAQRTWRGVLGPHASLPFADGASLKALRAGAEEIEGDDMRDDLVDRLLFLENVDLFEGLPADDLGAIAGICTDEVKPAGALIYAEGDPGDFLFLYIIVEGEVFTTKNGKRVLTLSPGESLGQVSFLDQGTRPVSAHASETGPVRLLRIERGAFLDLLSDRPGLMHAFFAVLASRLRALIERGVRER
jgi:hypothetical protein